MEIMMVILLVGILAGVAGPAMYSYLRANQMQTRVDRMVADLQYARALTISTGQVHRFNTTTDSYTLTNMVTGNVVRDVDFEEGAKLDAAQMADFFPWGMANTTTFDLSHCDMERRIRLLPTGMVEVERQ